MSRNPRMLNDVSGINMAEDGFVLVNKDEFIETMEELEKLSNEWIKTANLDYRLEINRAENKLKFSVKSDENISFYVVYPDKEENWMAWSENEDVLSNFQDVQEICDSSKNRPITDVLDVAHKAICKVVSSWKADDEADDEEDDDDIDNYYEEEDTDVQRDSEPIKPDSDDDEEAQNFFGGGGSPAAMKRLLKDLKAMQKESVKFGIEGGPRGDNLFVWDVKLTGFPKDSKLGQDLTSFASKHKREPVIYLEMQFPGDYPMSPPFVRVVRPRFKFLTGHVTIGGSICMEMLTKSGWRPTNDIESILVQVRSEIMSDPNARLDTNPDRAYGEHEARDAFHRMVSRYNWDK